MASGKKRQPTAADMVRSMAVLLLPVIAISLFFTLSPKTMPGTERVDWEAARSAAVPVATFELLGPRNMPAAWVPVRVAWEPGEQGKNQRWMNGWLSPEQIFFGVEQSNVAGAEVIKRTTRDGVLDGASQVNGQPWQRYVSSDDRTRALVQSSPTVTTVVFADASYEELEAFAATLAS